MRPTNPKEIPKYVPEFLPFAVKLGLSVMYDGRTYTNPDAKCPACGSKHVWRIGHAKKAFTRMITNGGFTEVNVMLQRYVCVDCRKTWTDDGPFYPNTDIGKPIVDLILAPSMNNSSYAVENTLASMGIQVSSDVILKYIRIFADRAREKAPLTKGAGLYGINMLQLLFGVRNAGELSERLGKELESCSDETYPRRKGAIKRLMEEVKVNPELARQQNKIVDGQGSVKFPDSFTLALSYLPGAEAYASLITTPMPFNELLAEILALALTGTSFNVTDGSNKYNSMNNHVLDPVHRARTELKHDKKFRDMVKRARELKKAEASSLTESQRKEVHDERMKPLDELSKYAKDKYKAILDDILDQIKEQHPEYFGKEGKFTGHITSNSMEGGNWRLKYLIRLPFIRTDTMAGKGILAAIKDSVYTMRKGKVKTSAAHRIGCFSFAKVMG